MAFYTKMTGPFSFISKFYILLCFLYIISNNEGQMQCGLHVLGTLNHDMIFRTVDMPSAFISVHWVNEKILKIHLFYFFFIVTNDCKKEKKFKFALFNNDLQNSAVWIWSCTDMSTLPLDRWWIKFERPIFCFALN